MKTHTFPPRIHRWLERFRTGAAQAYAGQWRCLEGIRVLLPYDGDPSPDMQVCCCPLTAQFTLEDRPNEPLALDHYWWSQLRTHFDLTEREVDQIAAAADGYGWHPQHRHMDRRQRSLSPLERRIRDALLTATGIEES